jgi:hypothetical protein
MSLEERIGAFEGTREEIKPQGTGKGKKTNKKGLLRLWREWRATLEKAEERIELRGGQTLQIPEPVS